MGDVENRIPILKIAARLRQLRPHARWLPPRVTAMGEGSWYIDEHVADHGTDWLRMLWSYGPDAESLLTRDEHIYMSESNWWLHASLSYPANTDHMPSYDDLVLLHKATWVDGWSYQVMAPASDHVNITVNVLHLWGKLDGHAELPHFGAFGTI